MIKTEIISIGDLSYRHTYSDAGRYVVRDGIEYSDAYDPVDTGRTYTEGDYIYDEDATPDDYEEALQKLGVEI